ncbi:MAG TPA: IS1182 family transposase [Streptosporangiaceae bacterium]|nr:IS1182 family transposase [Streptosporangiaceae bacterium]HYA53116.1 IS1182 family transposase [Streptosporangiaceae bacterium]
MQGRERVDRQLLDAGALVGHLVPAGSMFAFLAGHRRDLFGDDDFADLFPSGKGRPSVPASVMASVMVLQVLHDYSDAEAAEAARCDLRWKAACGFPLDHGGFDPSTLVYWRQRLAKSGRPHRISDAVRRVITETGVLKGRRRRAVDSTILADAVATQDTITQLVAAIRRVARVVPGAAGLIASVCTGHDYSQPGKPRIDWDDPAAKDALVSALVNDANALVAAVKDAELDEQAASAIALLALVAGQDAGPAEGSDGTDGRWQIARKVAEDRVISVNDPQARHTRKSPEARRDGYRAHVSAEPATGLITDEQLTTAAGPDNSDAAVAAQMIAGEAEEAEVYGDSAYGTGGLRAALAEAGHQAVIKPGPLKPAVEGGFTLDDFTVDEGAGTVTCPAGVTRPISARRNVTFGAACRGCPLRARCTTSKTGRALILHEHDALLRAARADWAAQPALRENYRKHRPNIERVISQVASRGGRRLKLRYLGTARNNAWLKNRTAALNLRNLISRGLARNNGAWTLT